MGLRQVGYLNGYKRTKGDFETVYLNRRIEIADPSWASSEGDSQSADAGPVPF